MHYILNININEISISFMITVCVLCNSFMKVMDRQNALQDAPCLCQETGRQVTPPPHTTTHTTTHAQSFFQSKHVHKDTSALLCVF